MQICSFEEINLIYFKKIKASFTKLSGNNLQTIHKSTRNELTLGDKFKLNVNYKGDFSVYGKIDTSKYLRENQGFRLKFSFPVYVKQGTGSDSTMVYYEKDKTFSVSDLDSTIFYVANWANEGSQEVDISAQALNVIEETANI